MEQLEKFDVPLVGPVECWLIAGGSVLEKVLSARSEIWQNRYKDDHERDAFDATASHLAFVGADDHELLGGVRLVFGKSVRKLPFGIVAREQDRALFIPDFQEDCVEVSRFFVTLCGTTGSRSVRMGSKFLKYGMFCSIENMARRAGHKKVYASLRPDLLDNLRQCEFTAAEVGLSQEHGGKIFIPATIEVREENFLHPQLRFADSASRRVSA
jgi:N-acyl-L-homoserine lactone synthetase